MMTTNFQRAVSQRLMTEVEGSFVLNSKHEWRKRLMMNRKLKMCCNRNIHKYFLNWNPASYLCFNPVEVNIKENTEIDPQYVFNGLQCFYNLDQCLFCFKSKHKHHSWLQKYKFFIRNLGGYKTVIKVPLFLEFTFIILIIA